MSKLTFKQQFFLNGKPVDGMLLEDIYAAISVEENRIKDLEKIVNKPKSLVAEIESANAAIKTLVAHLDSK